MFLKKSTTYLVVIFNLLSFSLGALSTIELADLPHISDLDAHTIDHLQGQTIQVRGFWYPTSDDTGILAMQPHLKSCCLTKTTELHHQLFVYTENRVTLSQNVVYLQGILRINPTYDSNGHLIQLYVLESAKKISTPPSSLGLGLLGLIGISFAVWFIKNQLRDS